MLLACTFVLVLDFKSSVDSRLVAVYIKGMKDYPVI